MLLEIIPSKVGPVNEMTTAAVIERFYEVGVYPDWWKLEPMKTDAAWDYTCAAVLRHDPNTRGIVVLGLNAAAEDLEESFACAARHELVKGFAVGRTIFGGAAQEWLNGRMSDDDAVCTVAQAYKDLCDIWDRARARGRRAA
jgi:5-dehydro-2-deoxygluconokinase